MASNAGNGPERPGFETRREQILAIPQTKIGPSRYFHIPDRWK